LENEQKEIDRERESSNSKEREWGNNIICGGGW